MKKIIILIFLLITSYSLFSQSGKLIRADKNYDRFKYTRAIELYSNIAENGFKTTSELYVSSKIGDCYRLINDTKNAEKWYQKAVNNIGCDDIYYFHYALTLKTNGKYTESKDWLVKYLNSNPNDVEAIKALADFDEYENLYKDSAYYTISEININTLMADFSPAFYNNQLIFVSSRDTISTRRSSWTEQPFYNLYTCEIDSNMNLLNVQSFNSEINSKYHEGPVVYDKNSQDLYFTRNNFFNNKKGQSQDETNYLKIYIGKQVDEKWQFSELPFNNDEYSCAHPALSVDGKRLYFASNMPGGLGGMDLYYADKTETGWSTPVNMDKPFNTTGNEVFPYVSSDNKFYFASDAHPGLGGFDLFCVELSTNEIKNLGYPVNTKFDDFGLIINESEKGFFSSNRKNGLNDDDIFFFKVNHPPVAADNRIDIEVVGDLPVKDTTAIYIVDNDSDVDNDLDISKVEILSKLNKNSTVIVKEGYIEYVPATGFKGIDKITYVVYDKTGLADTANVYITILKKTPPVAVMDTISLKKDSKDNRIQVALNDYDIDDNLLKSSIEIVSDPITGAIVEKFDDSFYYTPPADFKGDDFFVYRIYDSHGLHDEDTVFVTVNADFMGKDLKQGMEIALVINYDLGKFNIRPDAALILDSVVTILSENPTVEIEMGSHTDARGSAVSNQTLSQKRADAAVKYIVSKGIDASRLTAKGYGETELVNECKDGVKCSEEKHSENRRTTIKILKI